MKEQKKFYIIRGKNENGTYTYTGAYTNTDKLIGEEQEFTFYDQQNCYKEGNFTPLKI
jgi:hypothetical protein